jgi:hypothetical protein
VRRWQSRCHERTLIPDPNTKLVEHGQVPGGLQVPTMWFGRGISGTRQFAVSRELRCSSSQSRAHFVTESMGWMASRRSAFRRMVDSKGRIVRIEIRCRVNAASALRPRMNPRTSRLLPERKRYNAQHVTMKVFNSTCCVPARALVRN